MNTQMFVGGQSGIDSTFCGLPLVAINCQCRWTIFSSVWFCPGIMPFMYFFHDGCFYLAWVDRQSSECAECREPFAWSCCIYPACGLAVHVARSSAYAYGAAFIAVFSLYSRKYIFVVVTISLAMNVVTPSIIYQLPVSPINQTRLTMAREFMSVFGE
jgi:hypothetical protein